MTLTVEPLAEAYRTLGLKPGSSAEQIEIAYRDLIDGGGFKVGVPLRAHWQRAREIKEAYARICAGGAARPGSPDECGGGPLWPAKADDSPERDSLLRPNKRGVGQKAPPASSVNTESIEEPNNDTVAGIVWSLRGWRALSGKSTGAVAISDDVLGSEPAERAGSAIDTRKPMPIRSLAALVSRGCSEWVAAIRASLSMRGSTSAGDRLTVVGTGAQAAASEAASANQNCPTVKKAQNAAERIKEQRIPVAEESLRVGRRTTVHGRAGVRSFVREAAAEEQLTLRQEQIGVEHRPCDRTLCGEELEGRGFFEDRVFEIAEMREEAVVTKEAVVREDVIVRKPI